MAYTIKNLKELLAPDLDFIRADTSNLTTAGENYGSLIFAVDLTVKDGQNEKQVRSVAKMLPQNQHIQHMFNSQCTYRNEVGFYETIVPCLRQFQKDQGLTNLFNSAPDFVAARLSLDPSSPTIDEDAVLLIKNIKHDGFSVLDKKIGFDLDQSRLILDKMAELHSTVLALKTLKPDVFDAKLGQFFEEHLIFDGGDEFFSNMIISIIDLLKEDEFCAQYLDRVRQTLEANVTVLIRANRKELQDGPFVSLTHMDMWTNNIMVKVVNGKTVDVKFVDYQLYEYASLVRDVVFFLFTSVQLPVIKEYCDEMLKFYFDTFVKYLKRLKCDVSAFSFEGFLDEIKFVMKKADLLHIMLIQRPIYATEKDAKQVEEVSDLDLIHDYMDASKKCKEKASFIVREFIQRGWI